MILRKKSLNKNPNYIPADKRAFKFEKGTKITNIIEEMILQSEYGKELLNKKVVDGFFLVYGAAQWCLM